MKRLLISAAALAVTCGFAFATGDTTDPVLMTVDGSDVRVSEFEYLYNKNNTQQIQPQTVGEYLKMFIDYKLKVAEAENAGIDTTRAFKVEYEKFRNELAQPYLRDNSVEDKMRKELYGHMNRDLKVSHIMLVTNRTASGDLRAKALLDSIRTAVNDGSMTFADAARKYSSDQATAANGGQMGWITAGRYPWAFEDAAYNTPKGSISPVTDSGFGLHLIYVEDIRPARGEVEASHILKLTRGVPDNMIASKKAAIDSIYNLVVAGADFADMARRESEDPGSAKRGGELGWFGSGMMVAEFDSVAFALGDGEISKPFTTSFGYHIIKRGGHRGVPSYEEMLPKLDEIISRQGRADEPYKVKMKELADKYNGLVMRANVEAIKHKISMFPAGPDSTFMATLLVDPHPIARMGDREATVAEMAQRLSRYRFTDGNQAAMMVGEIAQELLDELVAARAIEDLEKDNVEYRNLINEYRDGILLFDISNKMVWDKASADKEGLEKFFNDNRKRYAWDKPKYKGYIIFADADSTLEKAKEYANALSTSNPEEFVSQMRAKFAKNVKIERVIAAKGDNPISDYVAFGGPKPENKKTRWIAYCAFGGKLLEGPEEAGDVRGAVTADYQAKLEKDWLKELHKKHKVKVDKKVLKTLEK